MYLKNAIRTTSPDATLVALAHKAFEAMYQFNESIPFVPYEPSWADGSGYLDGAVKATGLGGVVKSKDFDGRRILIVPVDGLKNVVYFDRTAAMETDLAFTSVCDFDFCVEHCEERSLVELSLAVGGTEGGSLTGYAAAILVGMAVKYGHHFEAGTLVDEFA